MAYEFTNLLILQETPKAFRVEQTRRNEKVEQWIPKSVITYTKRYNEIPLRVDIKVEDWFIEKEECKLII